MIHTFPSFGETLLLVSEDGERSLGEGENVVGRSYQARAVLFNETVSRRHAVIFVNRGTMSIRDLGSKNGTFVDGRRVGFRSVPIDRFSRIELGSLTAAVTSSLT